jgi:N-acetylmuramoyl-L-alanine amidase
MQTIIKKSLVIAFIIFVVSNMLLSSVYAGSLTSQLTDSRGKAIKAAKVGLGLYLLSKVDDLIDRNDESDVKTKRKFNPEKDRKFSSIDSENENRKIIVIDPGHGGRDPGAVGSMGTKEKDVNLDISMKLYDILKQKTDWQIYLTRKNDRFVTLSERTSLAIRLNADMFLSIHSNADRTGFENGIETYAHYNSNKTGWALAWHVQESLVNGLNLRNRGLKANNFQVIRETPNIDSVLLEIGYISNSSEERLLRKPIFRAKAARSIYQGILKYYRLK